MVDRRLILAAAAAVAFAVGWYSRAALFASAPAVGARRSHGPLTGARPAMERKPIKEAFEDIYKHAVWGENVTKQTGMSGTGSLLETTVYWRTFLARFMHNNHITSVVDAGCGDWTFSRAIDWTGIDYKGYDIVEPVIEEDKHNFEASNIHFFTANMIDADLPPADLLISKHVLQHLPNEAVEKFTKQFAKYKHVLIVNGVDPFTLSAENIDIVPGDYRDLDITAPPFNIPGAKVLTYWDGMNMHQVVHIDGHP